MPYNRSWALNAGVRVARASVVILHDADMVVPTYFARSIVDRIARGLDAVRLPRFLFYLDEATSAAVQANRRFPANMQVDNVVANNRTPVAVRRDSYVEIGGHDEAFFGWGAEDDEFMDRLRTLKVGEGAFLPIVHLWHPVAQKQDAQRNTDLLASRRALELSKRIAALGRLPWGGETPATSSQDSSIAVKR
jgi:GT2 family glycosyltransferase